MGVEYHAKGEQDIFYGLSYSGLSDFRSELQAMGKVKAKDIHVASTNPLGRLLALDLNNVRELPVKACDGIGESLRRLARSYTPFDQLSSSGAKTEFPREHLLRLADVVDWAVETKMPLRID